MCKRLHDNLLFKVRLHAEWQFIVLREKIILEYNQKGFDRRKHYDATVNKGISISILINKFSQTECTKCCTYKNTVEGKFYR